MKNSGVVFKWLKTNQKEIRNHRKNNGRTPNLQAHINKMHLNYIAMRPGAVFNKNAHGLFGYIYNPTQNKLLDCDELQLENISNRVGEMSKKGIDVYKTVISLREEDAIQYGYTTRDAWKSLIEQKINEIARAYKINVSNLEWVASYHAEEGHLHCHLLFWDRKQDQENTKMPFVDYKQIRKSLAKEVFKEDYQKLLKLKNTARDKLFYTAGKNIKSYYEGMKSKNNIKIQDEEWLKNFLDEVMPGQISKNVFSHRYKKDALQLLNERMTNLEKFMMQENLKNLHTDKINFRYGFQSLKVKEYINDISVLILQTSPDCKVAFEKYVNDAIKVQKLIGGIEKVEDIEEIKCFIQNEIYNRMGNEILKIMKETKIKEKEEQMEVKQDKFIKDYNRYLDEKLESNILYNHLLINNYTTLRMIESIFYELSNMSISENAKLIRLRKNYGDLSKQAQKEYAKQKLNSDGFDWYEDL